MMLPEDVPADLLQSHHLRGGRTTLDERGAAAAVQCRDPQALERGRRRWKGLRTEVPRGETRAQAAYLNILKYPGYYLNLP